MNVSLPRPSGFTFVLSKIDTPDNAPFLPQAGSRLRGSIPLAKTFRFHPLFFYFPLDRNQDRTVLKKLPPQVLPIAAAPNFSFITGFPRPRLGS